MAKTPAEFEKEFVETVKEKTGKTLPDWFSILKASGTSKPAEMLNWLKTTQGLNHLQSQLLSGLYLNGGKPVYQNEDNLLDQQFAKSPEMRPLFDLLSERILKAFPDTQLIPKKTYLSFTAVREFAAVNIKPKEIRLGLDLGDAPFTEAVQKAKLTGPMPRISHMSIYTEAGQLDGKMMELLTQSYNRSHKK